MDAAAPSAWDNRPRNSENPLYGTLLHGTLLLKSREIRCQGLNIGIGHRLYGFLHRLVTAARLVLVGFQGRSQVFLRLTCHAWTRKLSDEAHMATGRGALS